MSAEIVQAIAAIMAELPSIGKDDRSPEGYSYRGVEQVTKHLQPLLAKHKVVIIPSATVAEVRPSPAMKDGWTDVFMCVDWTIYGPDGSSLTARTSGIGRDRADKGANKAQTQAFKYLLLHLFCIADKADDADGQTYEHERAESEPAADETHRQAALAAIEPLSDGDKELVKLWMRNHRVPSLKGAGATLTQLNELHDYIAGLGTEPFLVDSPKASGFQGDGDAAEDKESDAGAPSPPPSPPQPVKPNPARPAENGAQISDANPARAAREHLSGSERMARNAAARSER